MKVAYVAGHYSADTDWERGRNIEAARVVAAQLWREGFAVICPHSNSAWMDGVSTGSNVFYEGYIEILKRCDLVVMVGKFCGSVGAMEEIRVACETAIPVLYTVDSAVRWRAEVEAQGGA
tara:strand:+ start:1279 stop:1638 length:360 start_codon:yes stop_codon:yes gene_type:complete